MRLTYRGNGSTGGTVPTDSNDYDAGDYATIKAPGTMVKDGALFSGWKCLANNKTYRPRNKMMVFHPTEMEAQWDPACVINYDTLNAVNVEGIRPFDRRRYYLGDKVTVPPHDDLTAVQAITGEGDGKRIEGYVSLQGWKIITGALSDRYILHAGDTFTVTGGMVVLQAVWAANEISIAYEINGAEGDTPAVQTALSGRWITLAEPTCTKVGYYFGGWSDMATGLVYGAGALAAFLGCTTLEAVWTPSVEYTVHYDANGASGGTPPEDRGSYHGVSVALPDPTKPGGIYKTGYTFAGWVLREPEFALFQPYENYSVTQDTTFYARWMPDDESLRRTVEYTSDETDVALDDDPPVDESKYVDGDFAFAKTWSPLKIGRIVTGWKLGDTVYKFGDLVPVQGNITLTAVWETIPPITLKFRGGEGATGTVGDIIVEVTGTILLPMASRFSRPGYFADGWIAPDGTKVASGALTTVNLDEETTELEYTVNWIDTAPEHTVTYLSVDHDSGHVPVDPCKYHAGDVIPLAPAGDLRKAGFELAAWDDMETGKTYSIPSNEEIIAYCNDPDRLDYDSLFPMMWCTGDHTLRAHWVPVAQLFFGSEGATSGLPPDPMRVRYDDSVRIPDKGTLNKNGYTLAGWKDEITGVIYKVGDIYQCVAPEVLTLQPVFQTVSIVEYIIPQGLIIANAAWMPKNGYCVNCHSKTVIVPPEMKGNYCWVRSDTGERITETCEIHDIYSDICLTLTPLTMSTDGDDRWICSTHWNVERGFTPRRSSEHRCGDYLEFPTNTDPEFAGWILNNDERHIYQPGEKVQIFGHAILRAVYPNATHVVTFSYPEGTLAEAPEDTEALTEGTLYQLPSGEGIRGPSGTKLLYWFGLDQTSTSDDPPIVRRWYPGEYLRVPVARTDLDADAKMLNTSGKLVVYPQFGNKFHVGFEDPDGEIMPEGGFVAEGVYAEMQAVRVPQVTKLDREEHTDAEWQAAWRIPYRAVDSTGANDYTYAGMFAAEEEEDPESNDVFTLASYILYGWLFYMALKHDILGIGTIVKSEIQKTGLPVLTTLQYEYDDTIAWEKAPIPTRTGFWFEPTELDDPTTFLESTSLIPTGWMYVGGEGGTFSRLLGTQYQARMLQNIGDSITYGPPGTCKWRAVFTPCILAHYTLADSMSVFNNWLLSDIDKKYEKAVNPRWVKRTVTAAVAHQSSYMTYVKTFADDAFDRPTLDTDFTYTMPKKVSFFQNVPKACDRWFPRVRVGNKYNLNPYLANQKEPEAPTDLWLDAVGSKLNPWATVGSIPTMPDPKDSTYAKHFVEKELKGIDDVYHYYVINFDLRWHRPEYVKYTYFRTDGQGQIVQPGPYKNITVTNGVATRSYISKSIYVPGETPIVASTKDIPDMALYVKNNVDGKTYGFSHWVIRQGSTLYKFYTDNDIPMEPKYWSGSSLPYVRPEQPMECLLLDAVYMEEAPAFDEPIAVEPDDTAYTALVRGEEWKKRKAEYYSKLSKLDAFNQSKQNEENARKSAGTNTKKKSNGIVDKVITGVKIFAGLASAAAAIFIGVTCLQHHQATVKAERASSGTTFNVQPNTYIKDNSPVAVQTMNNDSTQSYRTSFNSVKNTSVERMVEDFNAAKSVGGTVTINQINNMQKGAPPQKEAPPVDIWDEMFPMLMESHPRQPVSSQSPVSPSSIRAVYEKLSAAADAKEKYEDFQKLIRRNQALDTAAITDTDEPYVTVKPLTKRLVTDDGDHVMLTDGVSECYGVKTVGVDELQAIRDVNAAGFNYFGIEVAEDFDGLGLAGTPSPHQLTENAAEYAYIKYVPRDPDGTNWFVAGDTIPVDEETVPVITRYLTFTNEYDDNAPDSDTHTDPDEFREPHETFTVPECGAEAPTGKEFAGWILDENATTRSIVQPGDTIEQGPCNHVFKALWLPANPTRFPHFQTPAPIVPNPSEDAILNPVPNFPEPTEEEVD